VATPPKENKMSSQLIRKISAKTILGGKPEVPEKPTPLYTVLGIAQKTKNGTSDFGEWTSLVGQFEAKKIGSDDVVVAPQCFLPEPLNGMIAAQLEETDEDGNRVTSSVQFAIEVGVKPAKTATGYEYTAKEIIDSDKADPLAALREAVAKALPAPDPKKK
jgi:hypothetical protein